MLPLSIRHSVNKAGFYMVLCMNVSCIDVRDRDSNGICASKGYLNENGNFFGNFVQITIYSQYCRFDFD